MSDNISFVERLSSLEDKFKSHQKKLEGFGREMKLVLAEINIITDWIHEKYGIELINKKSFLFKHIHDYDDVVQEISADLSLLANAARNGPSTSPSFNNSGTVSGNSSITQSPPACDGGEHVPGTHATSVTPKTVPHPPKPSVLCDGPQPLKTIFRNKAETQQAQAAWAKTSYKAPSPPIVPLRSTSVEPIISHTSVSRPPPPPSLPPQKPRLIPQYFKPLTHYAQREEEASNEAAVAAAAAIAASNPNNRPETVAARYGENYYGIRSNHDEQRNSSSNYYHINHDTEALSVISSPVQNHMSNGLNQSDQIKSEVQQPIALLAPKSKAKERARGKGQGQVKLREDNEVVTVCDAASSEVPQSSQRCVIVSTPSMYLEPGQSIVSVPEATVSVEVSTSNNDCETSSDNGNSQGTPTSSRTPSGSSGEKLPRRGRPKKRPEDRVRTYDPRLPMQCDECGKVLKGSGALRVHKQIHSDIRPHECKVCGRAFRRKHHLEFHMMIHAGDKKETCSYCGKAFLIRRDLARHERTHTGEKPYSCNQCPKSFNVKQHLTLHLRTHTGERPYRCQICDKTFTQANSLRIHKKIHMRDSNANGSAGSTTGGANRSKNNTKKKGTTPSNGKKTHVKSTSVSSSSSSSTLNSSSGVSSVDSSVLADSSPEQPRARPTEIITVLTPSTRPGEVEEVNPPASTYVLSNTTPAHSSGNAFVTSTPNNGGGGNAYNAGWRFTLTPGSGTALLHHQNSDGTYNTENRIPVSFVTPQYVSSAGPGTPVTVIRTPTSASGGPSGNVVRAFIPTSSSSQGHSSALPRSAEHYVNNVGGNNTTSSSPAEMVSGAATYAVYSVPDNRKHD